MEIVHDGEVHWCPYCGSSNIAETEIDWGNMVRVEKCDDCDRHWQEYLKVYTLYIPLEYEEVYKAAHPVIDVHVPHRVFNPQPKPEKKKGR